MKEGLRNYKMMGILITISYKTTHLMHLHNGVSQDAICFKTIS